MIKQKWRLLRRVMDGESCQLLHPHYPWSVYHGHYTPRNNLPMPYHPWFSKAYMAYVPHAPAVASRLRNVRLKTGKQVTELADVGTQSKPRDRHAVP